jgi:truncated hemoglobin YjbI
MATQDSPSLYERLGGVYSIATVIDDFIDRIMVDPRLNANPRVDEAHHRVPPAGFKYLVTEIVCWATGGPQKYTVRTMKGLAPTSHDHSGRVGSLSRRLPANARQVRRAPSRAGRD